MSADWDPDLYLRFQKERRQPFDDLLAMLEPLTGGRVVDLGCGAGATTRTLHGRVGANQTVGLDRSEAMLARCSEHAGGGVRFERGDIARWQPSFGPSGQADLVFSNAALHWLDDHRRVLEHVAGMVAPGGQLAVQVPANHTHPTHVLANAVVAGPPFDELTGGWQRAHSVESPEWYDARLRELGFARRHVRLQVYGHELPDVHAAVEWVKGSLLIAYQQRLGSHFDAFLGRYRARLLAALGDARPFYYTYRRILMWGRKA